MLFVCHSRIAFNMDFFDCNLSYGPDTMRAQLPGCPDIEELRGQLDRAGIAGGLVYYAMREPILGNATLAFDLTSRSGAELSGNSSAAPSSRPGAELYGVWSLLPSCAGELAPPGELPAAMKQNGVAALTLNPQANRYLPVASAIGDYLAEAQERAIPVLFNTGKGLTLEQVSDLMSDFRDLTAILTHANCWPNDRLLLPFLDAYPNLYLDMTYIQTAAWLPDIVGKYSARRILFGSGFPECYPGAHMMVIKHAMLCDDDKVMIAGGNLRRILREARYD